MPPRQNFASILKSLKSDNSKTMLHPINENISDDYTQDAKSYVVESLAKRNTVKFAYELNPLPPPVPGPLTEVLRTKIKKIDEKHFTNIYKKTKKIVLPIEPKHASIPHNDSIAMATTTNKENIVGLKSIYFPFQNKPLADIQRRSSSKLIKLNKKVIVLPHTSMFDSSSRTSSAKSYLSSKTTRNTINHFFPKLTSKIQSESLVDINKTNGLLADVNVLSNSSLKVSSQPLSFLGQTSSTQQYEYLIGSQEQSDFSSKVKLYGTMCDPTPIPLINDFIDASETMSSKDNGSGLISTNMINSRRLPFLDNIYVKPNFAHYEKKFFDRHPDVLQNANLLNKQRFKLSISNIDRCMI